MAFTKTQVSELYVTLMGRASEAKGNQYWQDNFADQTAAAKAMLGSDAVKTYFGSAITADRDFVSNIYKNTLNKTADGADGTTADAAGINYWVSILDGTNADKPQMSRAEMIVEFIKVARESDTPAGTQFSNRVSVSDYAAENLAEAPEGYKELLSFHNSGTEGLVVTDTSTDVPEADALIDALNGGPTDGAIALTSGVDKVSGNIFNAERVFDPSGDDQMNSLQDDDVLTGTGDNPTLNFDYITDTQTGDNDISPTLNNIETINIKATNSFTGQLDVQDATGIKNINMTRMDNTFTVDNIVNAQDNLSVANSNEIGNSMNFIYTDLALSGTEDSVEMTLSNAQLNNLRLDSVTNEGYETINLISTGAANRIDGALDAEDLKTLNITGDANLRVDDVREGGSLTTVDASALTANLDFNISNGVIDAAPDGTSSGDVAFNFTSGTGDDIIRIADQIGATDSIALGEGADILRVQAVDGTNNYTATGTTITGVEAVELLNSDPDNAVIGILADEIDGDQTFTLRNNTDGPGNTTTYNIMNLSATEAKAIIINHSGNIGSNPAASSSNLSSNLVTLDVAAGVTEAAITIGEGIDTDVRFNFSLYTDSDLTITNTGVTAGALDNTQLNDTTANTVTSLTINDADNEDNTILLGASSRDTNTNERGWGTAYTDTITLTGGSAGQFLNLDAVEGSIGAGYGFNTSGTNLFSNTTTTAATSRDADVGSVFYGANGANNTVSGAVPTPSIDGHGALVATTITSTSVSDIIVRVGSANQTITTGTGNDTIIFDNIEAGTTSLDTAGLSSADTVTLGAGTDTIVLDGNNTKDIALGSSEWSGLSGVDILRLGTNTGTDATTNETYDIQVTNQLIDQSDAGNRITIINNDGNLARSSEGAVKIDLTGLLASNAVTFEGTDSNIGYIAQSTVVLDDVSVNSNFILNGGDNNTTSTAATATTSSPRAANGNNNILQIEDSTIATIDDLANISNFSTINFTTTQAVDQTLTMTLTDAIVDSLVDDSNTSSPLNTGTGQNAIETLTINAVDNSTSDAVLNLDLTALTAKSLVSIGLGGGASEITGLRAGADSIHLTVGDTLGGITLAAGDGMTLTNGTANLAAGITSIAALTTAMQNDTAGTASANGAAGIQTYVFTTAAGNGAFDGNTYLVINDDTAAIAATDTIVEITGVNGALAATDFSVIV